MSDGSFSIHKSYKASKPRLYTYICCSLVFKETAKILKENKQKFVDESRKIMNITIFLLCLFNTTDERNEEETEDDPSDDD